MAVALTACGGGGDSGGSGYDFKALNGKYYCTNVDDYSQKKVIDKATFTPITATLEAGFALAIKYGFYDWVNDEPRYLRKFAYDPTVVETLEVSDSFVWIYAGPAEDLSSYFTGEGWGCSKTEGALPTARSSTARVGISRNKDLVK